MSDIRCPRCQGLLVATYDPVEPLRCVNCGERLSIEKMAELHARHTPSARAQRKGHIVHQPKHYVG